MPSPFHVIVIGGGLGGLCLAQGLKKAGLSVAVYERDRTPSDRLQGYRIHIEPQGNVALAACLPADLFTRYRDTSGPGGSGYRVSTEQLRELFFFPAPVTSNDGDPATLDLSVSRITLRQILLTGLDGIVHFDKAFSRYEENPDGTITAHFEDGASARGDVLVAADGGKSRVRQQFLPHARRIETGVLAIMGKLALTGAVRRLLIPGQLDGATSILGPHGCAMFIALHELGNADDYLFWAFLARQEKYPAQQDLQRMDGTALQQFVIKMIGTWHPHVQQLACDADPTTIICKPLHTSVPVEPWATRRITLVGDAIHSMPPTRGIGGNTALRDAHFLSQELVAAQSGEKPLLQAIHDYEAAMIEYGFAAVNDSLQALHFHVADPRG
jgi:2-polyprenyl-6-methoxyphenol hydroxylase-like FAD-dependent oxidoreductase